MPDMTLQEALQTPEVQGFLSTQIQESVQEAIESLDLGSAITAALEEHLPTLRESLAEAVTEQVRERGQLGALHKEACRLIEASPLKGAAKTNLLADYDLVESGDDVKPGRALALIEAEMDADGETVKKSAKDVLRESVEADIARVRNVLRESAPSFPRAPGGGGGEGGGEAAVTPFLGEGSAVREHLLDKGLDPAQFGATPTPTPAT